jgi:hypothetical protein
MDAIEKSELAYRSLDEATRWIGLLAGGRRASRR